MQDLSNDEYEALAEIGPAVAEKPVIKIVTPEGRLISPASCWVVALTWDDEKEFAGALKRDGRIGKVVEQFGGDDLAPHVSYREARRG